MTIYVAGPESIHSPALVVNEYKLTMSKTGNGTIVPAAGEHTYIEGKKVMLVAAPDAGNVFIGWEGSTVEDSDSSPTQIIMNGNKTVNAVFQAQVTLTLVSTGGGTTIPAPAVIAYPLNEKVTLKATANDGYEFQGWTGDITDTSDIYELTMDADKTVGATFTEAEAVATNNKKLYLATGKMKAFWNVDGLWRFFATSVHKYLDGLSSDDHTQYHTDARGDARYYTKTEIDAMPHYEPLTNGDSTTPELLFYDGDIIVGKVN